MEILKRFRMLDCKAMTTPMTTNLKLLHDTSLETVDVTMYKQIIDVSDQYHNKMKHIEISFHYIREKQLRGESPSTKSTPLLLLLLR